MSFCRNLNYVILNGFLVQRSVSKLVTATVSTQCNTASGYNVTQNYVKVKCTTDPVTTTAATANEI